jgi:ABC-type nitrate/sulfonate/bicarbonate transport system permease component
LLAVLGLALFYLIELVETLLLPWHVSRRRGSTAQSHA